MNAKTEHQLLKGVKVLDLSQYIPGPFASRQLGDLGADVIKIEPPAGDPMRRIMYQGDDGVSPIYRHLNRGKKISRLDLKSEEDKTVFEGLLRKANVLLESYRPGVLDKLGFSREILQTINPKLVHCALSGYGQTGPYRNRAGHDINYCAASGALSVSGTAQKPVMTYPPMADHAGALQASNAILAALYAQEKQGVGAFLDISLFESILSWQYLPYFNEVEKRAEGLLSGGAACYNIYQCADEKFVSLGALEAHFWANFCNAVGHTDWIEQQYQDLPQHRLIDELRGMFAQLPRKHWNLLLEEIDCCYEALCTFDKLTLHPQLSARATLKESGPLYAGYINAVPPGIDDEIHEIDVSQLQHW